MANKNLVLHLIEVISVGNMDVLGSFFGSLTLNAPGVTGVSGGKLSPQPTNAVMMTTDKRQANFFILDLSANRALNHLFE